MGYKIPQMTLASKISLTFKFQENQSTHGPNSRVGQMHYDPPSFISGWAMGRPVAPTPPMHNLSNVEGNQMETFFSVNNFMDKHDKCKWRLSTQCAITALHWDNIKLTKLNISNHVV